LLPTGTLADGAVADQLALEAPERLQAAAVTLDGRSA